MKVLVIGGTLFIGRLLVDELVKGGHEVAILHRKPKHDFGRRVENIMADRNDADSMREALWGRRFEVVFDNAYDWENGTTAAQVEATVRLFGDWMSRYIFMSSVAAYGDGLNHKESDPLAPDYHADPYVRHKATTERMLFRMHAKTRLPVVTFRPPFVYGPGNPFYREQFFWDRLRAGRRPPPDAVRARSRPGGGDGARHDGAAGGRRGVQHRRFQATDAHRAGGKARPDRERQTHAGARAARRHTGRRRQRHDRALLFRRVPRRASDHRVHGQDAARSEDEDDALRHRFEGDVPVVRAQSQTALGRIRVRRPADGDGARGIAGERVARGVSGCRLLTRAAPFGAGRVGERAAAKPRPTRRVAPGNFTPRRSQNRAGASRLTRLVPPSEGCRLPSAPSSSSGFPLTLTIPMQVTCSLRSTGVTPLQHYYGAVRP